MRYLEVIDYETGECVKRLDVSGRTDRDVEKIEYGLLRKVDLDRFYVADTHYTEPMPQLNC